VWACADLVDILAARQEFTDGKPLVAFIISRAITNTKLGDEVSGALAAYGLPVLKAKTTQRVASTTAAEGRTVFNDLESVPAKEVDAIREEIEGLLNGVKSKVHAA